MTNIEEYDANYEIAVMGGSRFLGLDEESLMRRINQAKVVPDVSGLDVSGSAIVDLARRNEQRNDL